eukprot:TRINITY_DN16763_c0_g1_i1.p1 TRINITY_DN16763_c0_g1~~TRINITY_DN16763_c0_g1_i1.p1  ORF type:complete len:374 (+),score=27.95 TRINITY_DN16763_c0_g1_i1:26-1147(+)
MEPNTADTLQLYTETKVISVTTTEDLAKQVEEAVYWLCEGHAIGIPTETVYGLAANGLSAQACERIYAAKRRPSDNPLILHISDVEMLHLVVDPNLFLPDNLLLKIMQPLFDAFWPGPLTVLLPKHPRVPDIVTAGLPTVAVRFPAHPVARAIIAGCGFPLAAPSANLSGRPSPTLAAHVLEDLVRRIPLIVDGGPCGVGVESTVLDVIHSPPTILRPGGVTSAMLREFLPNVVLGGGYVENANAPQCPGLKYRHYSPSTRVVLFAPQLGEDVPSRSLVTHASRYTSEAVEQGKRVVQLFSTTPASERSPGVDVFELAPNGEAEIVAQRLFKCLRDADMCHADVIVGELWPEWEEVGVVNRLTKAASEIVRVH